MAGEELLAPKRKRLPPNFLPDYQPLPCPLENVSGGKAELSRWYYYTGVFTGDTVLVKPSGGLLFLQKWGFFGSPTRSIPAVNKAVKMTQTMSPTLGSKSNNLRSLLEVDPKCSAAEDSLPEAADTDTSKQDSEKSEGDDQLSQEEKPSAQDNESKESENSLHEEDPPKNQLVLSLVEAFFLSFGLGCLIVTREQDQVDMGITEMWRSFQEVQASFVTRYVAYHHFRCKGWVPKSADNYGADYALYAKGMPFHHSSYLVFIKTITDGQDGGCQGNHSWTWRSLMGLTRICEQVSKDALLVFINPPDRDAADFEDPYCIAKFKVQEMIVRRWVPNKPKEIPLVQL